MSHQHPLILSLIIVIASICSIAEAKTVYAITDHDSGTVEAYQILGNQLWPPYAQSAIKSEAIDITVDSQQKLLFLTLEGGNIICADANTLAQKGSLTTPAMAGIVSDDIKQRVYAVERDNTSHLYVCKWDGSNLILINIVTLTDLGDNGALGIALDKWSRRLYVTNDTNIVNYYNVDDPCWAHLGSRNVGVSAMDIDVDPCRGYLYIGGYQEDNGSCTYLVKHNLRTDVNLNTQQDTGTAVIGIAVDQNSGLVYVTTFDKQVRVYDCSAPTFINTYSLYSGSSSYSYPAGICIDTTGGWLNFTKSDDINNGDCVLPGREITYTITYDLNDYGDTNVAIVDYLPVEVDYNSSSNDGNYNAAARTVTWNIGTVPFDSNGTVSLKVNANILAENNDVIKNTCQITGNFTNGFATLNTPMCSRNFAVIYVDRSRTYGKNDGTSWPDAYLDLQSALNRASIDGNSQIWVARGTYKPSIPDPCYTPNGPIFKLINDVPVYGHFKGNEISPSQRNLNDPNNETILTVAGASAHYIITASGLSRYNILDGFTITGAYFGINIVNSRLATSNCTIQNNTFYGISINLNYNDSIPESRIRNCIIRNNGNGINIDRVTSASSTIITGCRIYTNACGIYTTNGSCVYILNNWVYRNSSKGIYFDNPGSTIIRNNTIVYNKSYGIYSDEVDTMPIITSSIIRGNTSGDIYGYNFKSYLWLDANSDPCFANADANDFHLRPQSPCIDAGDPCFMDFNDKDIDSECRVIFGKSAIRVDIGADELDWPKADFDRNKIVNFVDYAALASAWKTTNPNKSLDMDNDVDIDDLSQFCDDWLWQAPW